MDNIWVYWVDATARKSGNKSSVGPFKDYDEAIRWMAANRPPTYWKDRIIMACGESGELIPTCAVCGSTENVSYGPDPYASEIFGDDTEIWECEKCAQLLADDI